MRSMSNHDRYCGDALTIEPAITTGRLYHLPYGFPAMFDATDGKVFGEVMTFPDIRETLKRMDFLEGYKPSGPSHYVRISKTVSILSKRINVSAWVYIYPKERPIYTDFIRVHSGCWREHLSSSPTLFDPLLGSV